MLDLDLYEAKKLYPFQEKTVNQVLDELRKNGSNFNLLYQLPTGGGKTVIFSAIAKRYIEESGKKVLILTHRIELSIQTSKQLSAIQVPNKVINSEVKTLEDQNDYTCYIAMVETLNIARKYLVPKQVKNNGLGPKELIVPDPTLTDLIRYYTKEAGVRGLDRQVAKLSRKVVRERIEAGFRKIGSSPEAITITPERLEDYAGVRKFSYGLKESEDRIGQVTGLAWTSVGGELLTIEAVAMPGKGKQIRTGSLGDVMQESIQAAMTVARSRAMALGIDPNFHEKTDLHIHVPEGATPKDGPSAGIGMCTALVSVLANVPVRADVAMTGEITLRGQVLQIGGLKEKLLAAHRGGIKTVIIPEENIPDLKEIPDNVKAVLEIKPVQWIDQVLDIALSYMPEPFVVAESAKSSDLEQESEKNPVRPH